jgi:hypothetical protein
MKLKLLVPILFVVVVTKIFPQTINLVLNNKSDFKIILSSSASHWDSLASIEIQKHIKEISGAQLPIINSAFKIEDKEIVIGKNQHSEQLDISSVHDKDGYIIRTVDDKIYFAGGSGKGTLYAVYTFLEKYLGCRMYSSKVKIIPKQNSITIPNISVTKNPVFSYRNIYYNEKDSNEYCLWHKLVGPNDGKTWGMFVHTLNYLLPPEKYYKEHPEYYALKDSIRVSEEPCLTNQEVFRIVVDELRNKIKENPDAEIWSVSQNDNLTYCRCAECRKLNEQEDSPAGTVMNFVNKVAKEFPDKIISTLAYNYSRKAPKTIRPAKNVNIMLCNIECHRTKPLEADTLDCTFAQDLHDWSKLTNNIFIWDYVVQFTNYLSPFPNFQILQPNIQLLAKSGVKMVFEQGAWNNANGAEFNELRTYLIAKLLWNPNLNVDSVMNDFLTGYYGHAGKYIRSYIELITNNLNKSSAQLGIFGNPADAMNSYLSLANVKEYYKILNDAVNSVIDSPKYFERAKTALLPIQYVMLEQAKVIGIGEGGITIKDIDGNSKSNPLIINLLDEFSVECKKIGKVLISEHGIDADTYVSEYKELLGKTMPGN